MKISTDPNKIREILERGTEDIIEKDHLEKSLKSGKQLRVKFGIDPTGPSWTGRAFAQAQSLSRLGTPNSFDCGRLYGHHRRSVR